MWHYEFSHIRADLKQRFQLAHVLHHACLLGVRKMSVGQGITEMVESLHDYVFSSSREIKVPSLIPLEEVKLIVE